MQIQATVTEASKNILYLASVLMLRARPEDPREVTFHLSA